MHRVDGWRKIATVLSHHTTTAVLVTLALMVSACTAMSADQRRHIVEDVPATLDEKAHYLFHMHGLIVERQGPNAQGYYGQYRYHWTLEALADRGFIVISERGRGRRFGRTQAPSPARWRSCALPVCRRTTSRSPESPRAAKSPC